MSDIDLQLTREFFELYQFKVTTHWHQHDADAIRHDAGLQLYVENNVPRPIEDPDVVLQVSDLPSIHRAVVEVRPWHTDRLYASVLESNPILTQFAEPWALGHARDYFGTDEFSTILILSELPRNPEQRFNAIAAIQKLPVDHAMEFHTLLEGLGQKVLPMGTYGGSHTLQLLQLLKRYHLMRNQQMEFAFPMEPVLPAKPSVETVDVSDEKYAEEDWESD